MKCGTRNFRMRQLAQGRGSSTPGKTKGENCKLDGMKKFFMSNPKARKHKDYDRWHQLSKSMNK